jgi:hypothetical protein
MWDLFGVYLFIVVHCREDMLRQWSQIGLVTAAKPETDSESSEHEKLITLLKRTCKIIPDALDSEQKQQL